MSDAKFTGPLAHLITLFIQNRRLADLPYDTGERILAEFDRMTAESFPQAATVTKEIISAWLKRNARLHINTQIRKTTPVRQLCRFIQAAGVEAYLCPDCEPGRRIHYQPHLITERELKAFFAEIDRKSVCFSKSPDLHLTLPVAFRLLYSCGLRYGEMTKLRTCDVNLETGRLTIRKSKAHGMRIVMMSADMTEVMREYDRRMSELAPCREHFFHSFTNKGGALSHCKLQWHLCDIIRRLPEFKDSAPPRMRVHDLRHLFALSCIRKWVKEKKDLNALYPYLSTYMGHSSFEATDYYLHLSEDCQTDLNEAMKAVNDFLLGSGR